MNEMALFAGAGGGILGGHLLGWRTVCAVERDPYARDVLVARQNDGCLAPFPIWDDVCTFDGRPWRGLVDVVSGGFPCQDISVAGKGAGLSGERSGLWSEMRRIIGEVRPRFVFVENSPALTIRGGVRVIADLAALGYVGQWGVVGAHHAGAPHKRDRIWIVGELADAENPNDTSCRNSTGLRERTQVQFGRSGCIENVANASRGRCSGKEDGEMELAGRAEAVGAGEAVADSDSLRKLQPQGREQDERGRIGDEGPNVARANVSGREEQWCAVANGVEHEATERGGWWGTEPDVGRVADELANRMD